MRDAFVRALSAIARDDPSLMLVNGDLGFGVLDRFIADFPDQYVNAGVAEQNMTAIACGMALAGARAYTYSIGNFPTLRCLEQLRNDVCYHRANVTAVAVGAGFSYGPLGMSHFATEDLAILRALPEMTIVAPSDPWQAEALTRQLHARGGPAYLRLDKGAAGTPEAPVTLGAARTLRDGAGAVLFAIGAILKEALEASDALRAEGIGVRVVEVHTLKPLDGPAIVAAAGECGVVATLEEHVASGGLGGAVAETLLDAGVAVRRFRRFAIPDCFPELVGDQPYLRRHFGLDAASVADGVRAMVAG